MKTKHTPGPWAYLHNDSEYPRIVAVNTNDLDGSPNCVIVDLMGAMRCSTSNASEETRMNAFLIASAPDLLVALERALENMELSQKARDPRWTGHATAASDIGFARAAIAKAKGE